MGNGSDNQTTSGLFYAAEWEKDRIFLWDDALAGFGVCSVTQAGKRYM